MGGWPGSDNMTISVQLDLTGTSTGTELGNRFLGILSFISQDINIVKSWDISQMKGEIHRYVLSKSSLPCDIWEPKNSKSIKGIRYMNRVLIYI